LVLTDIPAKATTARASAIAELKKKNKQIKSRKRRFRKDKIQTI